LTATVLEETTQVIDTTAVNVAADVSKVALICQYSKNTRGMPRSRECVICESLDKLLPLVPRAITALGRQSHLLEKFNVFRGATQIFEQRISLDLLQSGVSLFEGTLQPFK
jgi:hypothetical protein